MVATRMSAWLRIMSDSELGERSVRLLRSFINLGILPRCLLARGEVYHVVDEGGLLETRPSSRFPEALDKSHKALADSNVTITTKSEELTTISDSDSSEPWSSDSDCDTIATSTYSDEGSGDSKDISIIRKIIAEETGLDLNGRDLDKDLGIDSFTAFRILSSIRKVTDMDVSPMLLIENTTIREIESALRVRECRSFSISGSSFDTMPTTPIGYGPPDIIPESILSVDLPPATSVLLQGSPKKAEKILFLLPDGSGCCYAYGSIPRIDPSVAVYGLNSPFMQDPDRYTVGIEGISALFLDEIRRRQPLGPYCLGGWSAGGVIAYEISLQLMQAGESVEQLVLLDSPCPVSLEPLPSTLHVFFDQIGLLGIAGQGSSPDWLLPHFRKSILALANYEPALMESAAPPKVTFIWAKDGVCKDTSSRPIGYDTGPPTMRWLLDDREHFGDNGWAQLLQGVELKFHSINGNHFTMMQNESVEQLAGIIRKCLT